MSAGEWIKHDGKGMPVAGDVMVLCRFNDGYDEELHGLPPIRADFWLDDSLEGSNWSCGDDDGIAEYKVIAND